jgi:hypothetical protein
MTYEEYSKFPFIKYKLSDDDDLSYTDELGTRQFKYEEAIHENATIWFADFEASTDGDKHVAFMLCYANEDGTQKGCFTGPDCGEQLLDILPDGANVYFHNLAYDGRLMAVYGVASTVQRGSKIYTMVIKHHGNRIYLKDSLCLLQMPLRAFPQAFGLGEAQKEVFPYNYYNRARTQSKRPIGIISEVGFTEVPIWDESTKHQFITNINRIPGCRVDQDHFDMRAYAKYYCQIDVDILRRGFNKFRQDSIEALGLDPVNYTTLPSLAHATCAKMCTQKSMTYTRLVVGQLNSAVVPYTVADA